MAAKKTTLNELGDMLTHVVKHMATKDDLAAVETRLDRRIDKLDTKIDGVESNLAAKIDRLDTKLTKFEENEIDKRLQLEVRVAAIENTSVSKRTSKPDPSAMHSPSLLRLLEISQVRRRLVLPGWH